MKMLMFIFLDLASFQGARISIKKALPKPCFHSVLVSIVVILLGSYKKALPKSLKMDDAIFREHQCNFSFFHGRVVCMYFPYYKCPPSYCFLFLPSGYILCSSIFTKKKNYTLDGMCCSVFKIPIISF